MFNLNNIIMFTIEELKAMHNNAVVLMRDDDNYIAEGEDADKVAKAFGILETTTAIKFKCTAIDYLLPILIRMGNRVVIND